jgi:hypothetical protein
VYSRSLQQDVARVLASARQVAFIEPQRVVLDVVIENLMETFTEADRLFDAHRFASLARYRQDRAAMVVAWEPDEEQEQGHG